MASSRKELSADDWSAVATYLKEEKERRAANRKELDSIWSEVDRQVRMEPIKRDWGDRARTEAKAWYPEMEMPQQFNTLEVIAADVRRMLFPRETAWYDVNSNLSDDYLKRFQERRQKFPLIGSKPAPMDIDAETANALVKGTIDHYHRTYDFTGHFDLCIAEALKYGTWAARVREVKLTKFSHDYRGVNSEQTVGPGLVPTTIRNTFLDDTAAQVMHEGMMTGPLTIYSYWQQLDDLKRAAKAGGKDRGWRMNRIDLLTPKVNPQDDKKGQVELIFAEGDLIVPRSRDSIFLPNCWFWIAVGQKEAEVVRFETNPMPFRSFVFGTYIRTDIDNPYGTSPLMKGQPVAEATTEIFCDLTASSRLNALPPVSYDRNDPEFAKAGGPDVAPGKTWATDMPEKITVHQIGDPSALVNAFGIAKKMYEELTGVTDPRRSAEVKSHTTATAAAQQADIGMARTEDFVSSTEAGPLTSMLYMEYAIAKKTLGKGQDIYIGADGIEGWVKVAGDDLPDEVAFTVSGASGLMDIKQRNESFQTATAAAVQLQQAAMATGKPFMIDFESLAKEGYVRAGIQNADKWIKPAPSPDPNAAPPPDPQMAAVQAQAQNEQMKIQGELQIKQAQAQQKGEMDQQKAAMQAQADMEKAHLDAATKIEVARIGAGADLQGNIVATMAQVDQAAEQMKIDHHNNMMQAAMMGSEPQKPQALGEGQRPAPSKPRRRRVSFIRDANGQLAGADIMEQ